MFIDSRTIEENKLIRADVCIVGAGVAGLTVAQEFIGTKADLCILESGGEKADKATQSLNWGKNVGLPYYSLDSARARFLGGTSHFWIINLPDRGMGVRLRPMDPIDFEVRDWVPHSGWPFNKNYLDPYYKRAQQVCRIGPYRYEPQNWIDPGIRDELKFKDDRINTTIFQFGDRNVFFKDYADAVKKADNIRTFLHGNAVEIETNEQANEVRRIKVKCLNGNRFSIAAKIYILAMGGLEVPRLLLLSNKIQSTGLGNGNDLVGRYFMEHPHLWCSAFFPANIKVSNATALYGIFKKHQTAVMGKIALSEHTLRNEKLLNWVTSIHPDYDLSYRNFMGYDKPGVAACIEIKNNLKKKAPFAEIIRHFGKLSADPKSILQFIYRTTASHYKNIFDRARQITVYRLNPMMEQAPNPLSRVSLDDEKDALGQLRIKLDWQLTELDTYTMTRAQEILDRVLQNSGLGHLLIETQRNAVPKGIHGGWHHMGTTRMHSSPSQGVVDPDCRVHGIANLYIGGASVFPTSGYANPVLTTIALVLRLADHIKAILFE